MFWLGLRRLNYEGCGSVRVQQREGVNTGFRFTSRSVLRPGYLQRFLLIDACADQSTKTLMIVIVILYL